MKNTYEISVYNQDVRTKIQEGLSHRNLESRWADVHLIEIRAETEEEAIASCRRKHPEKMGFIMGTAMQIA
ncbi:MAG: hypothetical protein JKY45_08065 [Emcibacter sp.]|nr:hypothetical protein [Emcibacter sp.]